MLAECFEDTSLFSLRGLSDFPFYPFSQVSLSPSLVTQPPPFKPRPVFGKICPRLLLLFALRCSSAIMHRPVRRLRNEDFASFKEKSVLSCNSTRFSWQPFIRLLAVAMATRQKLALSLSLCPNSFFFFPLLLTPLRRLCVK